MDDLEERLRRGLQHPSLSGDAERILADVHRGARARRQRRAALVAAGVLAVLTATGVLAGPGSAPDATTHLSASGTPSPSPTAGASAREQLGRIRVEAPLGIAATAGGPVFWLDLATCEHQPCSMLVRLGPEGTPERVHLFRLAPNARGAADLPPVELVAAADGGRDLWVSGQELWSSHDAGATWQRQDLPSGQLPKQVKVQVVGDQVFALQNDPVRLWRSPVAHDDWTEVSLPAQVSRVEDVTHVGDRLVLTVSDAGGRRLVVVNGDRWYEVKAPCQGEVPPISTTGSALFGVCPGRAGGGNPEILRSTDGETWTPFAAVRHSSYVDAVVPVDDTTVLVVTGQGGLRVTANGQEPVDLTLARHQTVIAGEFVTPERGYLLLVGPSRILETTDGGRTWHEVA